ncbi:MAG TPA: hypothetical protein VF929_06960 [Gemmatimonadaceae bacterium]
MMDSNGTLGEGAFGPEPERDLTLAALLREHLGGAPMSEVAWSALAAHIGDAVATQLAAPWWAWATRWERRVIPLALAAGIAASVALWTNAVSTSSSTQVTASDVSTAFAGGTPAEDVARQFATSVASIGDPSAGIVQ